MTKATKSKVTGKDKLVWLLNTKATISPDELHETGQMGGRNAIFNACNRGELPCFRMGRRIFIKSDALKQMLGMVA
jgi:hypothetical protein